MKAHEDAEELVFVGRVDQSEHAAEAELGDELEGFFGTEALCVLEHAQRAMGAILQIERVLAVALALALLPVDERGHGVSEVLDRAIFVDAERALIGELEQVADGAAAFAIEATDGHLQVLHGLGGLLDFAREDERGQVQQHGRAHAGARIGRAGGQESVALVEGIGHYVADFVVEEIGGFPGLLELQAAAEDLQAEVILLVEHAAAAAVGVVVDAARELGLGEFAADQVAFEQDLAIEAGELVDGRKAPVVLLRDAGHGLAQALQEFAGLVARDRRREAGRLDVARQADACAKDHVAVRAVERDPLVELGFLSRVHGASPLPSSSSRSLSR
jgi:hypothetical protein